MAVYGYFETLKQAYSPHLTAVIGAHPRDIVILQRVMNLRFPDAYHEMLLWMGVFADPWATLIHPDGLATSQGPVFGLRILPLWARNLAEQYQRPLELPWDALILRLDAVQACLWYIHLHEDENPSVWTYDIQTAEQAFIAPTYTAYLEKAVAYLPTMSHKP